jgi:hypothetical protein
VSYSKQNLAVSERWTVNEAGGYFRLLSTTGPVKVEFYQGGSMQNAIENVQGGLWRKAEFDRVVIVNQHTDLNTVEILCDMEEVGYDRMRVDIASALNIGNAISDLAPVTVGVAATVLVDANPVRRALRFFNAGTDDVYLGGSGVTTANGAVKLAPNGTYFEDNAAAGGWYGISGTAGQSVRIQEIR